MELKLAQRVQLLLPEPTFEISPETMRCGISLAGMTSRPMAASQPIACCARKEGT